MWKVIQTRWIRGSTQNFSNELGQFRRKRQALGEVKHQLDSHADMLIKHESPDFDDVEVLEGENSRGIAFFKNGAKIYEAVYTAVEENPEPKKPKVNVIAELEKILEEYEDIVGSNGVTVLFDAMYNDVQDLVNRVRSRD